MNTTSHAPTCTMRLIMLIMIVALVVAMGLLYACPDVGGGSDGGSIKIPSAPENVVVVLGKERLTIGWDAPSDSMYGNGTGTITGYKVYYSTTDGFAIDDERVTSSDMIAAPATTYAITGLVNGRLYYVVVTALNAAGESVASEQVSGIPAVLADKAPNAPGKVTAVAEITTVTITWKPPVDTGIIDGDGTTGIITGYKVYTSTVGSITLGDSTNATGVEVGVDTTTYTMAGLSAGTRYYVVVTALNDTGESAASSQIIGITNKVPSAPENIVAVAGNAQLTIGWDVPDAGIINGDSSPGMITAYHVYYSTTDGVAIGDEGVSRHTIAASTTTYVITGLTNGTVYYVVVTATNATGESVVSAQVAGTPAVLADTVSGTPRHIATFAGDTALTITWDAPVDTGITGGNGSPGTITAYKVYYSTTDGFAVGDEGVRSDTIVAPTTTYDITGLTNGTVYYVVVTALNDTGESATSPQIAGIPGVLVTWSTHNKDNPVMRTITGTAITTVDELKAMAVDGEYYLTTNIDLGTTQWAPLHTEDAPFTGTLYGNGYILYNMNIDDATAVYQGLFATLKDATVENLGIGVDGITASAGAGALAGYASGVSSLTNIAAGSMGVDSKIAVSGLVVIGGQNRSHAGGIVGYLARHSNLIDGWNEHLAVSGTGSSNDYGAIGGLVGFNHGGYVSGTASGAVSSQSAHRIGGLVGHNTGLVTGTTSGDVSSNSGWAVGGLVGRNLGEVTGTAHGHVFSQSGGSIGGLVGTNDGLVTGTTSGNVSAYGEIQAPVSIGGLAGHNNGLVIGTTRGNVSSEYAHGLTGGLVGWNYGTVIGAARGIVSSPTLPESTHALGGLVGGNQSFRTVIGYSTGWVMTEKDNTKRDVGAVMGQGDLSQVDNVYYNSDDGAGGIADHVGTIDEASTTIINNRMAGATGQRGNNNLATAIHGIENATAANMSGLTEGTDVGEWTFTAGQWPTLNLPEGITDYMDYTTSPAQPDNFVD